jgi:hypothetical protein
MPKMRKIDLSFDGESLPTSEPIVFVMNHSNGGIDLQLAGEVIGKLGKHAHMVIGEDVRKYPKLRIQAALNGVIWSDRRDTIDAKEVRKQVMATMIRRAQNGKHSIVCPEATWNITSHAPTLPFAVGACVAAQRGGGIIVPISAKYTLNEAKFRIHSPVDVNDYPDVNTASLAIRNTIATDIWLGWEEAPEVIWNKKTESYEKTGAAGKITRETAEREWCELKRSWLENYPFDVEYEMQFVKGYRNSPESVFNPSKSDCTFPSLLRTSLSLCSSFCFLSFFSICPL